MSVRASPGPPRRDPSQPLPRHQPHRRARDSRDSRRRTLPGVLFNNLNSFTSSRERADEFGDYILIAEVPLPKVFFFNRLLPWMLKGEDEFVVTGGCMRWGSVRFEGAGAGVGRRWEDSRLARLAAHGTNVGIAHVMTTAEAGLRLEVNRSPFSASGASIGHDRWLFRRPSVRCGLVLATKSTSAAQGCHMRSETPRCFCMVLLPAPRNLTSSGG